MPSTRDKLDSLRATITQPTPFCSGSIAIPKDGFNLFYARGNVYGRIDLSNASEQQLEHLIKACDPATFGVNQKDVLDESYRKAWKLDASDFAPKFNLEECGLARLVHDELLADDEDERTVRAELYKLNVYGKDSFFKAHKDTPRGDNMFGSLVIVFPTPHTGGALILRHGGKEWTLDSSKVLSEQDVPSIGYVTLYSDVEHEVARVESGHRVTLTYNLYFSTDTTTGTLPNLNPIHRSPFKSALTSLLDDPTFLPKGGYLGFGLSHQYPLNNDTSFEKLSRYLKGNDAAIWKVCHELSLNVAFKAMYDNVDKDGYGECLMIDRVADLTGCGQCEEDISGILQYKYGSSAANVKYFGDSGRQHPEGLEIQGPEPLDDDDDDDDDDEVILWATRLTKNTRAATAYIAYGNEASLDYIYGDLCLVVRIGEPGHRGSVQSVSKDFQNELCYLFPVRNSCTFSVERV